MNFVELVSDYISIFLFVESFRFTESILSV